MFATNLARNFDSAFVRRILQHVEVSPPDEEGRRQLWMALLPTRVPGRESLEWETLAKISDGLCGGDIKKAVILSMSSAVAREGKHRMLQMNDLTDAISSVCQSKHDVGAEHATMRWEDASSDEAINNKTA